MKISFTPEAQSDFDDIFSYIFKKNPTAVYNVRERILEAIMGLPEYPYIGRKGRAEGTREMVVPNTPYVIPYEILDDKLVILAIFHSSRDWPEKF